MNVPGPRFGKWSPRPVTGEEMKTRLQKVVSEPFAGKRRGPRSGGEHVPFGPVSKASHSPTETGRAPNQRPLNRLDKTEAQVI